MVEISVVELETREQLIAHLKATAKQHCLWWFRAKEETGLFPV